MLDCVVGGSGFIGSHLVEALLARGHRVRVLDIQPWQLEPHKNLEFVECDIRQPLPSFFGVDRVFHLAALADIVPSIENPVDYYDTNVTGTLNVLEACKKYGVNKFLYAASSSCYGFYPDLPEDAMCTPQYPYALTKHLGEQIVMHWNDIYKVPCVSLRLFNVYGLRSRTKGAYGAMFGVFLAQLANGMPLTVVGDGTQSRDFTHVSDVVQAFIMAAGSDVTGIYNVGTGMPVSVNKIIELMGNPPVVNIPKRPGEPEMTKADHTKIFGALGWSPKVTIEDGVQELVDNLYLYRDAPLWTPESIEQQTKGWFECLKSST